MSTAPAIRANPPTGGGVPAAERVNAPAYRNLYDLLMKTTLDINDALLASAKALAAQQRTSLTRLIEEGLQLRLRSSKATIPGRKPRLRIYKGRGGLVAGVDPLSNKALFAAANDDA